MLPECHAAICWKIKANLLLQREQVALQRFVQFSSDSLLQHWITIRAFILITLTSQAWWWHCSCCSSTLAFISWTMQPAACWTCRLPDPPSPGHHTACCLQDLLSTGPAVCSTCHQLTLVYKIKSMMLHKHQRFLKQGQNKTNNGSHKKTVSRCNNR